jgi:HD superfamily phosphodiesterase
MNDKAKEFFMKVWGNKEYAEHSEKVRDLCLELVEDTELNKDVFIVASWIHDLGNSKDKENHVFESMDLLDLFMQVNPEMKEHYDAISDCILHHTTEKNPETIYGKIFQYAERKARNKY